MTRNSIMQVSDIKECVLCRYEANLRSYWGDLPSRGLHRHHVMFGTANRKKSEEYGLWVWLCPSHHEFGKNAVHSGSEEGREYDRLLRENAQMRFEEIYGHKKWMEEFGKDYRG